MDRVTKKLLQGTKTPRTRNKDLISGLLNYRGFCEECYLFAIFLKPGNCVYYFRG